MNPSACLFGHLAPTHSTAPTVTGYDGYMQMEAWQAGARADFLKKLTTEARVSAVGRRLLGWAGSARARRRGGKLPRAEAATAVQAAFRGAKARRAVGKERREQRDAATALQAVARGAMARRRERREQKANSDAAIALQAAVRGAIARRATRKEMKATSDAAITVQAVVRGAMARRAARGSAPNAQAESTSTGEVPAQRVSSWRARWFGSS